MWLIRNLFLSFLKADFKCSESLGLYHQSHMLIFLLNLHLKSFMVTKSSRHKAEHMVLSIYFSLCVGRGLNFAEFLFPWERTEQRVNPSASLCLCIWSICRKPANACEWAPSGLLFHPGYLQRECSQICFPTMHLLGSCPNNNWAFW